MNVNPFFPNCPEWILLGTLKWYDLQWFGLVRLLLVSSIITQQVSFEFD